MNGATVTFTYSGSDNCAVDTVRAEPESGSLFPVGQTTVTVIARDDSDLTDSCTFVVIVTADDTDSDGIPDAADNCPFTYNPDQRDTDQDQAGDTCDNCPNDPNFDQNDSDSDGYGDACDICPGFEDALDTDHDGIPDGCDGCPIDPGKSAPGICGCGVPDTDTDGEGVADCIDICAGFDDNADFDADGLPDSCDNCPEIFNPDQDDQDLNGIGDACETESCCGLHNNNYTGNTDCSDDGKRNLADITRLIDRVYGSKQPLCCEENGNVDGDPESKLNLADITRLIDHIYIGKGETALCP
jgi:hypothetical protein